MKKPMTKEEYELCRLRYGSDIVSWPDTERTAAEMFLLSAEGYEFEQAEAALDDLLAQNQPVPTATSDFLSSLKDIPAQHSAKAGWFETISGLLLGGDRVSPVALASQAAVYLAVLGVGLALGLQSANVDAESVDLSEDLFASNAELFLEEE